MTGAGLLVQVQCGTLLMSELKQPSIGALTDEKKRVSWFDDK